MALCMAFGQNYGSPALSVIKNAKRRIMKMRSKRWIPMLGISLSGLLSMGMTTFYCPGLWTVNKQEVARTETIIYPADGLLHCDNGTINFKSDAALEVIEAKSNKLHGAIDPVNQTFAWAVEMKTFEGFNSALQREHFKENYLETDEFPKAIFQGKIIEKIDFKQDGTYNVRAKGKLLIHGVEQERILNSVLIIKKGLATVRSSFTVKLADHNINIPRIVYQKIAEEIAVVVEADLKPS